VSRKAILALALIATMAIGVTSASGAVKKYPTKILVADFTGTSDDGILDGALQTNSKCLGPRLMQASRRTASGFKVVDQDYTSAHGAWAFRGQFGPLPSTIKVEIARAKLRNRRGEVVGVCKPDTVQFTLGATT
jgi:hypothetical protein